jgi:PhnB protein
LIVLSNKIDEIKSFFDKMKVGGTVIMDLQETFWTTCYGSLTDKFGIVWQFGLEGREAK